MLSPAELGWDLGLFAQEVIAERFRVTAELAAAASRDPAPPALHHLRVSCRRLREAVSFFADAPEMPPLGKVAKAAARLMRSVRRLRELDVSQERLAALGDGLLDAEAERARAELAGSTLRERRTVARRQHPRIARRVRKLRALIALRGPARGELPLPGTDLATAEARARGFLEARMAERRAVIEELAGGLTDRSPDGRRLHEVRVALKHWRYACEIGRLAIPLERRAALAAGLRRLQDLGGAHQDLVDLARSTEAAATAAGKRRRKRLELLLQICVAAREDAAARFVDGLRAVLATTPLSSQLSERYTAGEGGAA